ncbi:hypothetical protein V6N11_017964 [Hibiscus sabdariffa]|uniref:DUF4283 domain-containing protein n=1 Tax=Hibiscus sabdariffa TaxID=183260 RepID=A0ABR2T601_9ROSI
MGLVQVNPGHVAEMGHLKLACFDSSDLHCPSLDGCDFEVCWSSPFGEDIDRWDSPLGAPVAGNLLQQRDFIGEGSGRQTSTSPSPTPASPVTPQSADSPQVNTVTAIAIKCLASKASSASSSRIQSLPFPDCTSATSVEPEVLSDLNTNQVIPVEQVQHEVSPLADHISQADHVTPPVVLDLSVGSEAPVSGEASQEQMPMSTHAELDTSCGVNDISTVAVISGGDEEGEVPDDVVDGAASVDRTASVMVEGVSPVVEEKPDQLGQSEQVQRDIPTLELEKEQRRRRVQGVVDDSKLTILESYAVGWCKQPISLTCLAGEMQNAGLRGMELMWITGKMSPEVGYEMRRAWLSIRGLPIHVGSDKTFRIIAGLWGTFIRLDPATEEPVSFERSRMLVEVAVANHIDEEVECEVSGKSFLIRVQEVELVRVPMVEDMEGGMLNVG